MSTLVLPSLARMEVLATLPLLARPVSSARVLMDSSCQLVRTMLGVVLASTVAPALNDACVIQEVPTDKSVMLAQEIASAR